MHLKHLQIIVQVGQLGSISKTAEKLYLSQPYISRILRALEEELEIVIFRRTKQGVEPTDVGKMFLREAGRILSEVRDLQMTYQSATQELEKLSVHAVPTSYAEIALIRLLRQIGDRQQRRFIYAEEKSYEVIENVSNGDADIGVLHCGRAQSQAIQGLLAAKNLCYKHIAWMARCVMVRQDHPLTRLGRPVTGEDLYDYAPVMYGLAADYYGGSDDFSAAYQDYFDMRRFCRQIKVSSRGAVHGMLRHTDAFSLGDEGVVNLAELRGIVSLPLDIPREGYESGMRELVIIYAKEKEFSMLQKTYIEIFESLLKDGK